MIKQKHITAKHITQLISENGLRKIKMMSKRNYMKHEVRVNVVLFQAC